MRREYLKLIAWATGGLSFLIFGTAAKASIALAAGDDFALNAPVMSDTGDWDGQFPASNAVNGMVTEPGPGGGSGPNEWLTRDSTEGNGPDSTAPGYLPPDTSNGVSESFTINLGSPVMFNEIDLYNTHNGGYNDRSTANFTIVGSDFLDANNQPKNPTTILTGTLSNVDGETTIKPDVYSNLLSDGPFQYVQFIVDTVANGKSAAGLDEIAIGTPEPACISTIGLASMGLMLRRRSR